MPKSVNQKLKLFYLARIMLSRSDEDHGLSMQDILSALEAEGIGAERKSIYNDLEALGLFGIEIEKRTEGNVTRYYTVGRQFTLPELKLLVDAVQASRFITKKQTDALIGKIESLASTYQARQLSRQVYVANRVKSENESCFNGVDYIHAAITENRKIRFRYFDWNEKKERVARHKGKTYEISPWALTWDDEYYYMIAYESETNMIKHYRVDKMMQIGLSDLRRDGAERFREFDMALYSKKVFSMFGGTETLVTLRCQNRLAGVMLDRFGTDITLLPQKDGVFLFSVRVFVSPPFLTWVMNFGDAVHIEAPENVKEQLVQLAGNVIGQY